MAGAKRQTGHSLPRESNTAIDTLVLTTGCRRLVLPIARGIRWEKTGKLACSRLFCRIPPAGFTCRLHPIPGIKKTSDCGNNRRFLNKIPGVVLLSHTHMCSTIAAGALNYRVREGNVCCFSAIDTRKNFQYIEFKKGS